MNKASQTKSGIVIAYFQVAAQMIVNLLFTPVTLRLLGQSEYGLYSTAASTISMLSMLSLGFNSSYIKKYSEYNNSKDEDSINKLNGMYLLVFSIIGFIAFICGTIISCNLKYIYDTGLTSEELNKARILMMLLTFNLSINFPFSVFDSIIGAHEQFIFQKLVRMLQTVISPIVMIPVLLMGFSSVGMVLTTITFSIIINICNAYFCFRKLNVRFKFGNWEKDLLKTLFKYTSFIAINIVADQINMNMDKIIIGRYRGTDNVAVYSVGHTIHACYLSLSINISNVFVPKVHKIANACNLSIQKASKEFTDFFIKVGRTQHYVTMLIFTGFIFYGRSFIQLWAGDGYQNGYYVCVLLMLASTIAAIQSLGIEIQRSFNKHQVRSLVYVLMAVLNLTISIFFCQWWGEIGSAIGTAISQIAADGIVMNIYYHKVLKIDIRKFWTEIIKISCGMIVPVIYGCIIYRLACIDNWLTLGMHIIVYTCIYMLSVYILSMNSFERSVITNALLRIKGKQCNSDSV